MIQHQVQWFNSGDATLNKMIRINGILTLSDEFIGVAQAASNGESNAFDAFGSSDQFNSNNVNDGFEASLGENAFDAFDEADSGNEKAKSNFNSSKNDDGFNVPDDAAFEDDAFSNAADSAPTTALVMLRTHSQCNWRCICHKRRQGKFCIVGE